MSFSQSKDCLFFFPPTQNQTGSCDISLLPWAAMNPCTAFTSLPPISPHLQDIITLGFPIQGWCELKFLQAGAGMMGNAKHPDELQPALCRALHGRRITPGWWHRGNYESNSEAL